MRLRLLLLLAGGLTLLSCKTSRKEPEVKPETNAAATGWPSGMQNMAQDVRKLLPFLYDKDAYQKPSNRAEIQGYLKEFAQAAHTLKPETGKSFIGDDLLLQYSLSNLREDLTRAANSYQAGQYEYSRSAAKASLSHCFQCHSVTQAGSSAAWDLEQIHNLNLAPLEKADLLVAARKYDKALTYMEGLLNSQEFQQTYAFDFESLLRRYLALIIRVEKAPARAIRELDRIFDKSETPRYIAEQSEGWRASLKAWAAEKKQPIRTAKDLFKDVEKRFSRAGSLQHFEKDHAGDVEYLRATAVLHQGWSLLKTPGDEAHALYLLGRAYEVLDELGSWNLHESYYEACVLKEPKAPMAQKCLNRLEASLYLGYSGSAGTHLPSDEKDRLKRLRERVQQ